MTALVTAVLQAHKVIVRRLDSALSPLGLTVPRFEVLSAVIAAPEGVTPMVRLCRTLGRHATTIGALVDGLEGAGLVARSVNRADRRETLVTITERGRAVASSAVHALDRVLMADPQVMNRLSRELQAFIAAEPADADSESAAARSHRALAHGSDAQTSGAS
ncbi:MarR family transcriptional regulator [Rhodococcus sp. T2V]|uniref:MarR family winged helix-turn-helix transcriptional regulator n=1 Tax=Rhodococcus sp. T2V TaxID=3034164 RepID=UPI0023E2C6C7|nr:MarR family transcriptional regulator [Rhodococcus sp. T2V]MDF3313757.1 MarR family transcriptional regulator [Rhodococcus sp. T2V]